MGAYVKQLCSQYLGTSYRNAAITLEPVNQTICIIAVYITVNYAYKKYHMSFFKQTVTRPISPRI
jgi:hypothetical protein